MVEFNPDSNSATVQLVSEIERAKSRIRNNKSSLKYLDGKHKKNIENFIERDKKSIIAFSELLKSVKNASKYCTVYIGKFI